jgi:hypothetical protein
MIAALWDDLGAPLSFRRKLVDADGGGALNDMVIEWSGAFYAQDFNPVSRITFQAVLYSGGQIQFNYLDLDTVVGANDLTIDNNRGVSATVGIWKGTTNPSPTDAISFPAGQYVPGLHSINGENIEDRGETNDSNVRLA